MNRPSGFRTIPDIRLWYPGSRDQNRDWSRDRKYIPYLGKHDERLNLASKYNKDKYMYIVHVQAHCPGKGWRFHVTSRNLHH